MDIQVHFVAKDPTGSASYAIGLTTDEDGARRAVVATLDRKQLIDIVARLAGSPVPVPASLPRDALVYVGGP